MAFLQALASDPGREVIYVKIEEAEEPERCCVVDTVLRSEVAEAFRRIGVVELYRYQYEAIQSIRSGVDTVIVAGTGLGKTEAFLAPIIERAVDSTDVPLALVMYPTKALARDQISRFRKIADRLGIRVMVYDGDTPPRERRILYEAPPHVLITNPDMVSQALMYIDKFRTLIRRVKYVVLDDFHVYSGVFGTHMYYLLRRIKRFVTPVFIATSATVGNPSEFAHSLFQSKRVNIIWGPLRRRGRLIQILTRPKFRSKWSEAAKLASICIDEGIKCIVFTDSHRYSEIIYRALKLAGRSERVAIHRAGLDIEDRRRVEEDFKKGRLDVVISTPTLEIGIDIGDVDAAILASIPPSFNRYLQRVGRVGRRGQTGYAVQILGNDPISQYYRNYPHEFFSRAPEPLGFEKENTDIAKLHILAATLDKSWGIEELSPFEYEIAQDLLKRGLVKRVGKFLKITPEGRTVLKTLSLRGSPHVVKIKTKGGEVIGERELPLALYELHPEAIYMHGGRTYVSKSLDLDRKVAVVEEVDTEDLVTQPLEDMEPELLEIYETGERYGVRYQYGKLKIRITVFGYALKRFTTDETLGEYLIEPLSYEFITRGSVLYMPYLRFSENDAVDWEARAKGYHATEHVLISATEIALGASKTDMGGISYPNGVIVLYDSTVGGNGTTKLLLQNFHRVVEVAYKVVTGCDCFDGCPKCVFSPYCGNNNKMLSRRNAARVLAAVLQGGAKPTATGIPKERGLV
ncbi:MAG: DEAD/DEAH box helicase [Pyrobaculum sp.]